MQILLKVNAKTVILVVKNVSVWLLSNVHCVLGINYHNLAIAVNRDNFMMQQLKHAKPVPQDVLHVIAQLFAHLVRHKASIWVQIAPV